MRVAVAGVLVLGALAVGLFGASPPGPMVPAQDPDGRAVQRALPSDQMIALSCEAGEGQQQVTLVDPKLRVMSVYHVDRSTGEIKLKSVRNVQWDLLMEEFNGSNPLPREIRALLEQR